MIDISCDTCMDLIPLVRDGLASHDSEELVRHHLAHCAHCRKAYGDEAIPVQVPETDRKVVRKLKRNLLFFALTAVLLGISLGLMMMDGMNMFYNALIMPLIGGLGYVVLRNRCWYAPVTVCACSFVWEMLHTALTMQTQSLLRVLQVSLAQGGLMALIYTFFCLIGTAIAWLLTYALSKENL